MGFLVLNQVKLNEKSNKKMIQLIGKCLIGAFTVLLIALLSKTKNYYIAGLVPLFPTFSLIAHVTVFGEQGALSLKNTALFGLWSIVPYFAYLLLVYLMSDRFHVVITLITAILAWIAISCMLIYFWGKIYPVYQT